MKTQINLWVDVSWKPKLEAIARRISVERNKTVLYVDLLRELILEFISGSVEGKEEK